MGLASAVHFGNAPPILGELIRMCGVGVLRGNGQNPDGGNVGESGMSGFCEARRVSRRCERAFELKSVVDAIPFLCFIIKIISRSRASPLLGIAAPKFKGCFNPQ
jgi:hypothetical protein